MGKSQPGVAKPGLFRADERPCAERGGFQRDE